MTALPAGASALLGAGWAGVTREADIAAPGTSLLAEVDGVAGIVVRGRDGVVRAFHNVCRQRGVGLVEERCGSAGRRKRHGRRSAFDQMCADRYLGDEFRSRRSVRSDYSLTPMG